MRAGESIHWRVFVLPLQIDFPHSPLPLVNDLTVLLNRVGSDAVSAEELLPLVYEELRRVAAQKMAREMGGQTLQATALVHEAWIRVGGGSQNWENRAHFFGAAAEAMRRILI